MTIYFYRMYMTYEGKIINYDIKGFINSITKLGEVYKTRRDYNKYPIALEYKKPLNNGKESISFYKYRTDYKPFIKNADGTLGQIKNDVVEVTNCCFDWTCNIMGIQFLFEGVRDSGIKKYLNSFIGNKKYELKIEKIYKKTELNNILNCNRIFSVDALLNSLPNCSMQGDVESGFFRSLSSFIGNDVETTPQIKISLYNNERGGSLNGNALRELLDLLEKDEESIEKITDILISYKGTDGKNHNNISINSLKEALTLNILNSTKIKTPSHEIIMVELERGYIQIKTQAIAILQSMNTVSSIENMEAFILKENPTEKESVSN